MERLRNGRLLNRRAAVLEAKRPPGSNGCCGLKYPLGLFLESSIYNNRALTVFQGGDDGRGYRNGVVIEI